MRVLLWVRVLNQVGAFALAFLAVVAGPHLVTAALTAFGVAALASRWAGGVLLDRVPRLRAETAVREGRWRPPRALVKLTGTATAYAFGYLTILMFTPFVLLQRGSPAWAPGLTLAGAAVLAPVARRSPAGRSRCWSPPECSR